MGFSIVPGFTHCVFGPLGSYDPFAKTPTVLLGQY